MSEQLQVPYRSIPDMFLQRVAATPDAKAFAYPGASGPVWLTWRQVGDRASAIAAGLHGLGVQPEDRVAIACGTRVEWIICDLGILCAGAATTTIYPTTEPKDAVFILRDSGSKVLIAENATQAAKLDDADLPDLTHIVVIDGVPGDSPARMPVLTLAELEQRGKAALADDPDLVTTIVNAVRPDQLATLMYTSGTTGTPKGVELLHGGWCLGGRTPRRSSAFSAPTTCSTCGCRCPTRSARRSSAASSTSACPPMWTVASTSSSRTSARSSRR